MTLRANDLDLGYDRRPVVEGVSLDVLEGKVTALVGPNASGKSTLLKGLARVLSPLKGAVLLDGRRIHEEPPRRVARSLGILPQGSDAPEGLTVADLVSLGRYPHRSPWGGNSDTDRAAIAGALERTGMAALAARPLTSLSGGQRQKAWIAMALAQDTAYLLLDEPIAFLDVAHQLEILEVVRSLNREAAKTVVVVLHELSLAARFADHVVVLHQGKLYREGPPETVLTPETLRTVFNIEADWVQHPGTGIRTLVTLRSVGGLR